MRQIEITTKIGCRNVCIYYPQDKIIAAYAEVSGISMLSFETLKTCLDKTPKNVCITFAGMCEPWLNPECTNMETIYNLT